MTEEFQGTFGMIDVFLLMPIPNLSQPVREWRGSFSVQGKDAYKTRPQHFLQGTAHPKNILTEEIFND